MARLTKFITRMCIGRTLLFYNSDIYIYMAYVLNYKNTILDIHVQQFFAIETIYILCVYIYVGKRQLICQVKAIICVSVCTKASTICQLHYDVIDSCGIRHI